MSTIDYQTHQAPLPARQEKRLRDAARNLVVLGLLWVAYSQIRSLTDASADVALAHGRRILDVQDWLGIDIERAVQQAIHAEWLYTAFNTYYLVHFPATVLVLVWMYFAHRSTSFVALRNGLITATAIALVVHGLYPLAPPRMLEGFVDSGARFGPNPYSLPGSGNANQFAAMPSMHVGWAVLVALAITMGATSSRRSRLIWLHPLATSVVVVATANHYIIDVLAGAAIAAIAWKLTSVLSARNAAATPRDDVHTPADDSAGAEATGPVGAVAVGVPGASPS